MEARVIELRNWISEARKQTNPLTSRCIYPKALKRDVAALAWKRRDEGRSQDDVSAELGLSKSSVSRWMYQFRPDVEQGADGRSRSGAMVPVRVRVSTPQPASLPSHPSASSSTGVLRLVTPGGYRLEGLSLGEAAQLLGVLSCCHDRFNARHPGVGIPEPRGSSERLRRPARPGP